MSAIPFHAYPALNDDACYFSTDHDVSDLCAQWRAAKAAEASAKEASRATTWAIVGTLLALLTTAGLFISIRQTGTALKEAQRNADAAANQVSISERVAHTQLRAYVGIAAANYHYDDRGALGGHIAVTTEVKNFGITPAYQFRSRVRLDALNAPLEPAKIPTFSDWIEEGHSLAPSTHISHSVIIYLTSADIHRFKSGSLVLFIKSHFEYEDHAGHRHSEVVHMKLAPGPRWITSHGGNPIILDSQVSSFGRNAGTDA